MLGLCREASYDGQAPIRLQAVADPSADGCYPFDIEMADGLRVLSFAKMIAAIASEAEAGAVVGTVAGRFHNTVAAGVVALCRRVAGEEKLKKVVLSGGVFQNDLLLGLVLDGLREGGLEAYAHELLPPNDACLSLGQAAVALARQASGEI